MGAVARVALRPYNEAPRAVLADRRGTVVHFITSSDVNKPISDDGQPGPIISLHWLRPELEEATDV